MLPVGEACGTFKLLGRDSEGARYPRRRGRLIYVVRLLLFCEASREGMVRVGVEPWATGR